MPHLAPRGSMAYRPPPILSPPLPLPRTCLSIVPHLIGGIGLHIGAANVSCWVTWGHLMSLMRTSKSVPCPCLHHSHVTPLFSPPRTLTHTPFGFCLSIVLPNFSSSYAFPSTVHLVLWEFASSTIVARVVSPLWSALRVSGSLLDPTDGPRLRSLNENLKKKKKKTDNLALMRFSEVTLTAPIPAGNMTSSHS